MRDLFNNIHPVIAVAPAAAVTDNTAFVSAWIDRKGYEALTFLLATGVNSDADAAFTVLVEHADLDDKSDSAAVPDIGLIGTEVLASYNYADDGETRKIGYIGGRRYARITVTPSGNTGNVFLAILALLGFPALAPAPNPPV